jgi:hypothetical protein
MIPAYTISTLLWILRASHKRKDNEDSPSMNRSNHKGSITRINDHINQRNVVGMNSTAQESLRTKAMRLYAIFRSRTH